MQNNQIDVAKIKFVEYRRKSTESEDRQIASLDDQRHNLKLAMKNYGITEHQIIDDVEESKSAKKPGRTGFNKMVDIISNQNINGILVWHPNRLSRNSVDTGTIVYLMDEGLLDVIVTPQQIFYSTPNDKFLFQLLCSQAKLENDNKGIDVRRGMNAKVRKGFRPLPSPPGYLPDKEHDRGEKQILIDPVRFSLIRQMWDLLLTGNYLPSKILDIATNEWGLRTRKTKRQGGKSFSLSQVYVLFHNPFYYGKYWWKDEETGERRLMEGRHKSMISEQEFNRAQLILGKRGKPQPKTREFAYTGTMTCGECSSSVTAEEKHQIICTGCKFKFSYLNREKCPKCQLTISVMQKPTVLDYTYYHCTKKKNPTCCQKSVRLEELERQYSVEILKVKIDGSHLKIALDYLNEKQELEVKNEFTIRNSLQEAFNDCDTRILNLNKEYTSPQNIRHELYSPDEFKRLKNEILKERTAIEQEMNRVKEKIDRTWLLSERTFNFCAYSFYHFNSGNLQRKREIFTNIGSNLTLKDGKLHIQALEPYMLIEKEMEVQKKLLAALEPKNNFTFTNKNKATITKDLALDEAILSWLPG